MALPDIAVLWAIALASAREKDSSATDAETPERWFEKLPVLGDDVPIDGCPML